MRRSAARGPVCIAALIAVLALAPPARAAGILERAASELANDPVYVDPAAEEQVDEARIERAIETSRPGPVYIVVLPGSAADEAGGDATEALRTIAQTLRRNGTYAGVIGNHFRALSNTLGRGQAGKLATAAFEEHRGEGVTATLVAFVERVATARNSRRTDDSDEGTSWLFPGLLVGGLGLFLFSRSRRRVRENTAQLAEVKQVAREDLIALAEDVQRLETRVEGNGDAKASYDRAIRSYERASGAFDRARTPKELSTVAESLEEGRYEMAAAEAVLEGRAKPERRPPCFFDPRHGPSTRDVDWAPPGGAFRRVPACEADAVRVENGEEPLTREIAYGGRMVPYYAAPAMYGGYFGGFLPGLLIGNMLGGPFGWGGYSGGGTGGGYDDGGSASGGDFGSFGGGDFGGGDFGGGGDF